MEENSTDNQEPSSKDNVGWEAKDYGTSFVNIAINYCFWLERLTFAL